MSWLLPGSIQKHLAKYAIRKALGHVLVADLDSDEFDFQLSEGIVELQNARLNCEAVNDLLGPSSGFSIHEGQAATVHVAVPWGDLWSSSCEVNISGLDITVRARRTTVQEEINDDVRSLDKLFDEDAASSSDSERVRVLARNVAAGKEDGVDAKRLLESVLSRLGVSVVNATVRVLPHDSAWPAVVFTADEIALRPRPGSEDDDPKNCARGVEISGWSGHVDRDGSVSVFAFGPGGTTDHIDLHLEDGVLSRVDVAFTSVRLEGSASVFQDVIHTLGPLYYGVHGEVAEVEQEDGAGPQKLSAYDLDVVQALLEQAMRSEESENSSDGDDVFYDATESGLPGVSLRDVFAGPALEPTVSTFRVKVVVREFALSFEYDDARGGAFYMEGRNMVARLNGPTRNGTTSVNVALQTLEAIETWDHTGDTAKVLSFDCSFAREHSSTAAALTLQVTIGEAGLSGVSVDLAPCAVLFDVRMFARLPVYFSTIAGSLLSVMPGGAGSSHEQPINISCPHLRLVIALPIPGEVVLSHPERLFIDVAEVTARSDARNPFEWSIETPRLVVSLAPTAAVLGDETEGRVFLEGLPEGPSDLPLIRVTLRDEYVDDTITPAAEPTGAPSSEDDGGFSIPPAASNDRSPYAEHPAFMSAFLLDHPGFENLHFHLGSNIVDVTRRASYMDVSLYLPRAITHLKKIEFDALVERMMDVVAATYPEEDDNDDEDNEDDDNDDDSEQEDDDDLGELEGLGSTARTALGGSLASGSDKPDMSASGGLSDDGSHDGGVVPPSTRCATTVLLSCGSLTVELEEMPAVDDDEEEVIHKWLFEFDAFEMFVGTAFEGTPCTALNISSRSYALRSCATDREGRAISIIKPVLLHAVDGITGSTALSISVVVDLVAGLMEEILVWIDCWDLAMHHRMTDMNHWWLFRLLAFFTTPYPGGPADYPAATASPSRVTKLHLRFREPALRYTPYLAAPTPIQYRAALRMRDAVVALNVVRGAPTIALKIFCRGGEMFVCPGRAWTPCTLCPESEERHMARVALLSRGLAGIMRADFVEVFIRSSDANISPSFEVIVDSAVITLDTRADSFAIAVEVLGVALEDAHSAGPDDGSRPILDTPEPVGERVETPSPTAEVVSELSMALHSDLFAPPSPREDVGMITLAASDPEDSDWCVFNLEALSDLGDPEMSLDSARTPHRVTTGRRERGGGDVVVKTAVGSESQERVISWLSPGQTLKFYPHHFKRPDPQDISIKQKATLPQPVSRLAIRDLNLRWMMRGGECWPDAKEDCEKSAKLRKGDPEDMLEVVVTALNFAHQVFPPSNDSGSPYMSRIVLDVKDFEVVDRVRASNWNKMVCFLEEDDNPRMSNASMLRIVFDAVTPEGSASVDDYELRVKIALLPLRLHIDQDALLHLIQHCSACVDDGKKAAGPAQGPSRRAAEPPQEFFQRFHIGDVRILVDYKPKHVDYAELYNGGVLELLNFFHVEDATLELSHVTLRGVRGWSEVIDRLLSAWIPHVRNTQIPSVLSGLQPFRSMTNVGAGMCDLIVLPVQQYRRDGRLMRGLKKGASSFLRAMAVETLTLGAQLAVGTQSLLEAADYMVAPDAKRRYSDGASKYSAQPGSAAEGLTAAHKSIAESFMSAGALIVAVPLAEFSEQGGSSRPVAVVRAMPVAVLRPSIGVSEGVAKALLGVRNSLSPARKRKGESKYR